MTYAELHLHTNYSFQEGASSIGVMVGRAAALGYQALAVTDHDNLCGAVEFAETCRDAGIQPIIGCEVTLTGGYHLTLLSETRLGQEREVVATSRSCPRRGWGMPTFAGSSPKLTGRTAASRN